MADRRGHPFQRTPFLRRIQHSGYLLPAALTGALWLKGVYPGLPGWPCPLRALSGIPCPTCFLTRATAAALSGDLAGALHWHPLGPLAAASLLIWSAAAIRHRRLIPKHWPLTSQLRAASLLLVGVWLLRGSLGLLPG